MKRIDPTFKEHALTEQETNEFLDELLNNLFDNDDISNDSDKIPDLGTF